MPAEIKFCGLTRAEDAHAAARLGARWMGTIFAGGPRNLRPAQALEVLRDLPAGTHRVGVFGRQSASEIAGMAREAALDTVQLHGDPAPDDVEHARAAGIARVWAVVRVAGAALPESAADLFAVADAVVLDTRTRGALGGTGRSFDWEAVARSVDRVRGSTPLVVAGGLDPANVAHAIAVLRPDVVDVSSGVESAPGIKDHERMRAFADAVRLAGASP
ncbi:MAG TPA: phosphoribosylanthranilate isomerase [Gemmatimonadaceae bacterium]|nr:phosphoribosylanthranilate isomerase [Gemmatimonadaceae bacterium]